MKVRKHNTPTVTPMTAKLVLEVGTAVRGSGLNVGECVGAMVGTGVGVPVEGAHVVGVLGHAVPPARAHEAASGGPCPYW